MSFQIRFNPANRVITAAFFGRVALEAKLAAARQVAEKYGHLHPLLLLVDVRRANIVLTPDERRAFGSFAAHLPGLSHGRTAVLHALDCNANVIIDSSAQAEGMDLIEFVTEQAALDWLTNSAEYGSGAHASPVNG